MHGVVAAATCTVPKVMHVSGEKSLINTHTCALGDEVVKISGMVDVSPLKFWCVMISFYLQPVHGVLLGGWFLGKIC